MRILRQDRAWVRSVSRTAGPLAYRLDQKSRVESHERTMAHRFDRIFRYMAVPLQMAPLLLIVIFSALMLLAIKATLFGIALALFLLSGFFKYSFVLLDQLAEGRTEPPVLSIEMMNPIGEGRSLPALVFVVAVFFVSNAAVFWFGLLLALVIGVLVLTALIAIIAVQGATGSLVQSLNPVRCWRLILRLRGDFILVLACAFVLCALIGIASAVGLPFILQIALFMYAWLALFSLIGGLLYERRAELGLEDAYEVETVESDDGADLERARQQNIDRVYAEWRGGSHKNAWQSVTSYLAQSAEPLAELRWLYERAKVWPDQRLANRLAQETLPRLLVERHNGEAIDVLRERLSASAEFRPLASADLIRLVQLARDAGDRRVARELLRDFERFYPNDPATSVASLLTQQLER